MTKRLLTLPVRVVAAIAALALLAAGCAGGDSSSASGEDKTITWAMVPGWTDHTILAHMFKIILEDNGYNVDLKEVSDLAPVFAGVARGDLDVMCSWPEKTHKAYWEEYKDKLEDLGAYNHNNILFLGVPDYVDDVQSIADLRAHASEFGGKIIGIEPGAGITKLTKDNAFPDYGLDDSFKLLTSSTPAMLTELKKATGAHKPIVVTSWAPFWASEAYNLRPLEDPKGAYGQPEGGHLLARKGFSDDFPEVADMIAHLKLTAEQQASLEDNLVNKYEQGQEEQAIQAWLDENPDFAQHLEKYLQK